MVYTRALADNRVRALHKDREDARKHAAMGFELGWGAALDQLVAIAHEIV